MARGLFLAESAGQLELLINKMDLNAHLTDIPGKARHGHRSEVRPRGRFRGRVRAGRNEPLGLGGHHHHFGLPHQVLRVAGHQNEEAL